MNKAAELLQDLAVDLDKRVEAEANARARGEPIPSPLSFVVERGSMFTTGRPYPYLTKGDLDRLEQVDAQVPWSESAKRHLSLKQRVDALEAVLAETVKESGKAEPRLSKAVSRLEDLLQEYTFIFPLDNMEVPDDCVVRIGSVRVRRATTDDWNRYCHEVYARAEALKVSQQDKGAIVANDLLYERELRPDEPVPVLEVRAWGSPQSAYNQARDDAHFALAALQFFATTFEERVRQTISIKGENVQRQRGWRVRFAAPHVAPAIWHDGTGPSLPFRLAPPGEWPTGTKEFMDALNRLLDAGPRTPAAQRLITAIYWVGSALNQPALTEDEPLKGEGGGAKPSGVEVGRRIRDLVTAMAAMLKDPSQPGDWSAMDRLRACLTALDPSWCNQHWESIRAAYKARHAWTHEGVGPVERAGAVALKAALQELVPRCVIDAANGRVSTEAELLCWLPAREGGT